MLKKVLAALLVLVILPAEAFACTAVCLGSNLTADGSTIFGRLAGFMVLGVYHAGTYRRRG